MLSSDSFAGSLGRRVGSGATVCCWLSGPFELEGGAPNLSERSLSSGEDGSCVVTTLGLGEVGLEGPAGVEDGTLLELSELQSLGLVELSDLADLGLSSVSGQLGEAALDSEEVSACNVLGRRLVRHSGCACGGGVETV